MKSETVERRWERSGGNYRTSDYEQQYIDLSLIFFIMFSFPLLLFLSLLIFFLLTIFSLSHLLLPPISPFVSPTFSVVTIGFDQTVYRVNESVGAVEVCASVRGGVVLDRQVVVQYSTADQSAVGMKYGWLCVSIN